MERTTAFSPGTEGARANSERANSERANSERVKRVRRGDVDGAWGVRVPGPLSGPIRRSLIGFGLFIALWALAALFFPAYVLPSPAAVLRDLSSHIGGGFAHHLIVTLGRVGLGFLMALLLGTSLGVGGYILGVTEQLNTLMLAQQVLPGTILGVIFLLIFGIGGATATALVAFLTLPLIAINTANGLAGVDPQLVEVLTSMGGSTWDLIRYLYLPTLVPTIQSNLTAGFGLALKVAILGEFMGAQDGLGYRLNVARVYFRMDEVFFYLFIVLLISLVFQIVQSLIFTLGFKRYFDEAE